MWKGVREFFHYSRKQRNGVLILLAAVVVLWVLLLFDDVFYSKSEEQRDFTEFRSAVEEWERKDSLARIAYVENLFPFDPNTLADSLFLELGLSERQVKRISNYREKGGRFYKSEDLAKIYGIDSVWHHYATPYIQIAPSSSVSKAKDRFNFNPFDPNTVSVMELEEMGLYDWQARNILAYRNKVKPFRKREQLYKVYGLDSNLVTKLLPYVNLDTSQWQKEKPHEKIKEEVIVEINSADSIQLMDIRGIGPSFARRIVKYRQRLGGFYTKEQLLEVYGMDSVRYERIKDQITIDHNRVVKLDLNSATFRELLRHPYLEYEVVKNIVNFREHARPYKKVEELKQIELVDDVLFSKIAKYLEVDQN